MTFDYKPQRDIDVPSRKETACYILLFAAALILAAGVIDDIEHKTIHDTDISLAVATR